MGVVCRLGFLNSYYSAHVLDSNCVLETMMPSYVCTSAAITRRCTPGTVWC